MKHEADYDQPDHPSYRAAPTRRDDMMDLAQRVTALEDRVTALEVAADKKPTRSED